MSIVPNLLALGWPGASRVVAPVVSGCLLLAAGSVAAEEAPAEDRLQIHGFLDVPFAYNFNRPADHANFFPGVGTSAKRDDEFSLNLAQLEISRPASPVGFQLALGVGTATEVVHAFEPVGTAVGPEVWRQVVRASVQYQTKLGRGLLLEGGIYPSHIGMEAFATKDNWNYTRSWLGELSPYYQTGLKLAYPVSDRWSAQLHLVNGWQTIADNNRAKSLGMQLAYAGGPVSFSWNGLVGSETGSGDGIRALGDVVATYQVKPSLALGFAADLAREGRASGDDASWWGAGLYARYAPPGGRSAIALRAESYDDGDGAISGTAQTLRELTFTLEHRPVPALILKLESRYDRSSADVFATDGLAPDGSPLRKQTQLLLLLGVVAVF
ncbi:MAG: outer membrane beta-barrel protein [Vicinamibacteria bacterium]